MPYCNIESHKNDPDWNYRVDACPYCQIDDLRNEIKRLQQYEDAVVSAKDGSLLVWNFADTNRTVVEHTYWLAQLERIERLETALRYYAQPETYYIDFKNTAGLPAICVDNRSIARAALKI